MKIEIEKQNEKSKMQYEKLEIKQLKNEKWKMIN